MSLPRGSTDRRRNDGNEPLVFEGYARPAVDLDLFLQAIFEVLTQARPAGLRSSTWPISSYGIVIRRPY